MPQKVSAAEGPEDQRIELEPVTIEGRRIGPQLARLAAMPELGSRNLPALRTARGRARTMPQSARVLRELATVLWNDAASAEPAAAQRMRGEARDVLARLVTLPGSALDDLRRLAVASSWVGTVEDSRSHWQSLLSHAQATSVVMEEARSQLAVALLRAGRLDEARELVRDLQASNVSPELAYVMAWLQFAARDSVQLSLTIETVVHRWPDAATMGQLLQELGWLLASSDVPAKTALELLGNEGGKQATGLDPAVLLGLYEQAGAFDRALSCLERVERGRSDEASPEAIALRALRASLHQRLGQVQEASARALENADALRSCAEDCKAMEAPVVEQLRVLAQRYHTLYPTAYDENVFLAADRLYTEALRWLEQADAVALRKQRRDLRDFRDHGNHDGGRHSAQALALTVHAHSNRLRRCFENVLAWEEVGGEVRLLLELDQEGRVLGGTTDPAPGQLGLAGVSRCALAAAREWRFAARARPGTTVLEVPLLFTSASGGLR